MYKNRGFTLVELLICVVVIGLLALFAYPEISKWKENETIRSEAFALSRVMMMARIDAIQSNCNVAVLFISDTDGVIDRYESFEDDGGGGGDANDWERQSGEKEIYSHDCPDGFSLTTNFSSDRMRFKGRSSIVGGTVLLRYQGEDVAKVVVSLSGRVRIENI